MPSTFEGRLSTIDDRISTVDGRVSSLSSLGPNFQKIVETAISKTIRRMDTLHQEHIPALKTNYETRISHLETTIHDLQRSMVVPPPPVPTAADVVNKHVQQQLDQLKNNVSTLASSGNTLAEHVYSLIKPTRVLTHRLIQTRLTKPKPKLKPTQKLRQLQELKN